METKKVRSSNIELLRILAMFMIVTYHIVYHCVRVQLTGKGGLAGGGLFNQPVFHGMLHLLDLIMPFGGIGNDLFILISGYFMARKGRQISLGNMCGKIASQLGFAALALTLFSGVLYFFDRKTKLSLLGIRVFNDMSWFVGYYVLVMICAYLFLNDLLQRLDKKGYKRFLLAAFALIEFAWSRALLEGITPGLQTLCTGIFLYGLGGYLRTYDPFRRVKTWTFGLVILAVNGLIYLSVINSSQVRIAAFLGKSGYHTYVEKIPGYANENIVVLLIAISIFEIFRRLEFPASKVVNFIGSSTLMIYLIHDNKLFYSIWALKNWERLLYNQPVSFWGQLLLWAGGSFAFGLAAYSIFLLWGRIWDKLRWIFLMSDRDIKKSE